MLPFLDDKREKQVTIEQKSYDLHGLSSVAEEIRSALEQKNDLALSRALRAFFNICDSLPHEEGEHE